MLTVEPGLYFQADDLLVPEEMRGIGIRIEDDILVTADGAQNLSASLPRTSIGRRGVDGRGQALTPATRPTPAWSASTFSTPPRTRACAG